MSTRPWSHVDGHTCTDLSLPLVDRGITVQFSSIPLIPAYVAMPTFQVIALAAAGALLFDPVSSSLLIRDPKNPCVRQPQHSTQTPCHACCHAAYLILSQLQHTEA